MDYKLFTFSPQYDMTRNFIHQGNASSYYISSEPNGEEYDYQGFEYEPYAIEKVCSHAVAMIIKLDKDVYDQSADQALSRDYRNALKCLAVGKHSYRERIDAFTEFMLIQKWNMAIEAISEAHNINNNRRQEELLYYKYIPDYSKMLVEKADYALFFENNFVKAINEYKAATYEWKSKNNGEVEKYSLSVGEKQKIKKYVELYISIHTGGNLSEDDSFLCNDERKFIKKYRSILYKYEQHETIGEETEAFVSEIEKWINAFPRSVTNYHPMFELNELNTLRTISVIWPMIFNMAYLEEIDLLSQEKQERIVQLKEKVIHKIASSFKDYYSKISYFMSLNDIENNKKWDVLILLARTSKNIKQVKQKLLVQESISELAYYTSWKTLSYMLPKDNPDENAHIGKLSVMHHSYMNDPLEGNVITQFLFGQEKQTGRQEESHPYTFIKCFTQSIDYLPMWKMYGDEAKGCCIVVDWQLTKTLNPGKSFALYKVCYLTRKDTGYYYHKKDNNNDAALNGMEKILEELKKNINQLRADKLGNEFVNSMLGSILYLFKDSSYSYEKETRILYSYDRINDLFQKTSEEPPKLFVYTDYCVVIKEIILGPKFENTYLWTPFIQSQLEKMNNMTGKSFYPTVLSHSEINFR